MNKQDARTAIIEHIHIIVGPQQCIERNRHRSYPDRPKESGGHLRRVQHKQGHALFQIKPQPKQSIPNTVSKFSHLRVTIRLPFMVNSSFAAAPLRNIAV